MKTYTILGSTGNTGSVVANHLLKAGANVRVTGRNLEKLTAFTKQGAEAFVGDQSDAAFLTRAFSGADAAYILIPSNLTIPDYTAYADGLTAAFVTAIKNSGLKSVVFLSSLGAHLPSGTGPISALYRAEQQLKSIPGLNVLSIRAGYFMSNFFGSLGMIKHAGINGGVVRPDIKMAMVSPADIGAVAAHELLHFSVSGFQTLELAGERELDLNDVTRKIGAAIGKPELPYITFTDEQFFGGLVGAGLSESMASNYVEMSHGMNTGKIVQLDPVSARNTAPTRFEAFLPALAGAYKAMN